MPRTTTAPRPNAYFGPAPGDVLFADDFDGPAGALPSAANWGYNMGRGEINWNGAFAGPFNGWGSHDKQYFTDTNARLDGDSHVVLTARRETPPDNDPDPTRGFTSARMVSAVVNAPGLPDSGTANTRFVPPVQIEIRARLEPTQGLHYAIWLLGGQSANDWPNPGEVDIAENNMAPVGEEAPSQWWIGTNAFQGTVPPDPENAWAYTSAGSEDTIRFFDTIEEAADWHVYTVTWLPGSLSITYDNDPEPLLEMDRESMLAAGRAWPYDTEPQLLIFSLKVGGDWVLAPAAEFEEARMVIDYVRATRL